MSNVSLILEVNPCMHASKAFILLVLQVSWLSSTRLDSREYQVIEMFSGISMIASTGRMLGLKCAALDLEFDKVTNRQGAMDLGTAAGFVCRG